MKKKIMRHINNIKRYGLMVELKTLFNNKIKGDHFDYDLKYARQNYYQALNRNQYEPELKRWYYDKTGHMLDLANPRRFTEKIQYLKLYGFGDMETKLADKYRVREWVKNEIGEEYLIPLLGVWENPDDIDYSMLPDSFVLKGNHGSQMNLIIKDKSLMNVKKTNEKLKQWLLLDFAHCLGCFEMQYQNIPRRIIAEKYMVDDRFSDLVDYKFHCFNGKPEYCEVILNRTSNETIDYFDMEWKHQNFIDESVTSKVKNSEKKIEKPELFEEMKNVASILCRKFSYVRVDLYNINKRIYFGEMTFSPSAGADIFNPDSADFMLGELLELRDRNYKND